jgi:hypothetical protein
MYTDTPPNHPDPTSVDGIMKFLHYRDPQNENEPTATAFMKFLVVHKDELATAGDNALNELYEKFKADIALQ